MFSLYGYRDSLNTTTHHPTQFTVCLNQNQTTNSRSKQRTFYNSSMQSTQLSFKDVAEQTDNNPNKTAANTTTTETQQNETPSTPTAAKTITRTYTNKQTTETTDTKTETTCPECTGTIREDPHSKERICTDCGLVVDDTSIDHGPEWRAYNAQEHRKKSRTGSPSTNMVHDKGLSTTIDWKDRDANGNMLNAKQRRKMSRLRTWDERARAKDSQERNLKQALGEIERMSSALGIPDNVREMASVIYRRCLNEDLLRGRCIESMTTASLYAASRQAQLPRSLDEFINVARIEEQPIARAYRYISRELNLKVEPPKATQYIPKLSSEVGASNETENLAEELLQNTIDAGEHSGKHPNGLAAAALYAADLLNNRIDKITQAELADSADVCEVTIRNRHREILEVNNEDPRLASPGTVKSTAD